MRIRGIPYSSFSFNSLLSALLRRCRTRSAARLFHLMLHLGVPPDTVTFNTLVRGFCLNSMLPEAFQVFSSMSHHRCDPDVVTYNTLLDGLIRAGKITAACDLFEEMRNRSAELAPNIVSYTTLIRGFCGQLMVAEAIDLLEEMISHGLKPNEITYNTLMKGFCEAGRLDLMKKLLDEKFGFKPDICTFNTLIAAHCNSGDVDEALKVFDGLPELKVKADCATYSTLVRGLCFIGKFERAEVLVDDLLEKNILRSAGSCIPIMAAYNPLFEYLCNCGKTKKARKVLRELIEGRTTIDPVAFKTIILGHCKEGTFLKGYNLLVSMVMRDIKPDYESCQALLIGFILKGNVRFAFKVLKRILDIGHRPSTDHVHFVLTGLLKEDGYANEAADLIFAMVERRIHQNIDLSTDVIHKLFGNGLNERAFRILQLLYGNGFCVKMEKLMRILCCERRFLEARDLLLFSLEKKESLNPQVLCMVVNGLCEFERASEAFDLFYNVLDVRDISTFIPGESDFSSCMNSLRLALEKTGMLKEAEFVSGQISRNDFRNSVIVNSVWESNARSSS